LNFYGIDKGELDIDRSRNNKVTFRGRTPMFVHANGDKTYLLLFSGERKGEASETRDFIGELGPALIVLGIVGLLLYRRFAKKGNKFLFGSQGTGTENTLKDFLFGSSQQSSQPHRQDDREAQLLPHGGNPDDA
jgi:hypothetical protein